MTKKWLNGWVGLGQLKLGQRSLFALTLTSSCGNEQGFQFVNASNGIFSVAAQQCIQCAKDQYILDSNNAYYTCQQCPLGAVCDGVRINGRVQGSVWQADWQSGQYKLVSCPAGYELLNSADNEGRFSYLNQQCSLCPATFYCIGGSGTKVACPNNFFSTPGANASESCVSAVFVEVTISIPMTKDEFSQTKQNLFSKAISAAAATRMECVILVSISQARRANDSSVQIVANIATADEAGAFLVESKLTEDNINSELSVLGLPKLSYIHVAVLNILRQPTTNLGMIIGASVGGVTIMFLSALASFWILKWRKRGASRRLIGAKRNTPANQWDLPYELRGKYEAVQVVGSGAFGIVLEAYQISNKKRNVSRAIKIVHSAARQFTGTELRRLDREVKFLRFNVLRYSLRRFFFC